MGQRSPAAAVLNYKDGHYAIDSYQGKHDDTDKNVLTWLVCYPVLKDTVLRRLTKII